MGSVDNFPQFKARIMQLRAQTQFQEQRAYEELNSARTGNFAEFSTGPRERHLKEVQQRLKILDLIWEGLADD